MTKLSQSLRFPSRKGFASIYCIKKYGYSPIGCPERVGSSCREMTTDEIDSRYQKKFSSSSDYMIRIASGYGNISFNTVQILLSNHGYSVNPLPFEANYHLRNEEGKYNQLAELISDKTTFLSSSSNSKGLTNGYFREDGFRALFYI